MFPTVSVGINGSELVKKNESARVAFEGNLREALRRTAELAAHYAKLSTLYKSHTYKLRASIKGFVINGMGGTAGIMPSARVAASAPYALYVEGGTRPHIILPRRKRFLSFFQNGKRVWRKGVFHPGTAPRPFMAEARERTAPIFEQLITEAFIRAFV